MEQSKEKDRDRAKEQAQCQFESIREMVERLKHARECTDDECTEGKEGGFHSGEDKNDIEAYHDEENAQQIILEDALDVSVRSDWHPPGEKSSPTEYTILLCTGGPAVRVRGQLNQYGEPESAELECQDWFTAWQTCDIDDPDDVLLTYAQQFYFGG